ncbi:MAG: ribbon-helix-helix protein, CopG family [Deltaproteobacteria bacterium]|nr:ribbon-helix-helix protein, CopG family [Deltaproteobacteria bacterium]
MVRTQIYLDQALKRALSRESHHRRVTVSELIRQAIEQFLKKGTFKFNEALEESFGLWSKRKDIGNTSTYVRKIRREWEKREKMGKG